MVVTRNGKDFIGYEYKDKVVRKSMESLYLDSYPCFGWEEDPNMSAGYDYEFATHTSLRFRRDRKICNKTELTRLQRNFDGCVSQIETMERSKNTVPSIWAMVIGVIGTVFMALATFSILGMILNITAGIVFAIPGFAGWIAPYFVYRKLQKNQGEKISPQLEEKYDELYEICEKASKLLV